MTDRNDWQDNAPGAEPGPQADEKKGQAVGMPNDSIPDERSQKEGSFTSGRAKKIASVDELPVVHRYLNRIGEGQWKTNLKSARIDVQRGNYPQTVARMKFSTEGVTITIPEPARFDHAPEDFNPTEAEDAAIKAAMAEAQFFEMVPAWSLTTLPARVTEARAKGHGHYFEFYEPTAPAGADKRAKPRVWMIQIRIDGDLPGDKHYENWTYWEDDQWRRVEPDVLPLYNAHRLKEAYAVFIHEGAKAAAHCQWMTDGETREAVAARAAHPWGDQLAYAVHVGWVGGALSPGRTDWSVIAKAGVKRVYIVTDHDDDGESAVKPISKALVGADIEVDWIKFDDAFPAGFDLGDTFPAATFQEVEGRKRYQGPTLRDCMFPATWATRMLAPPAPEGRGRPPKPKPVARKTFLRQWAVVTEEGKSLFVLRRDRLRKYAEEAFNTRARPFSDVRNTADLLRSEPTCAFDGLAYRPGLDEAEIIEHGRRLLNNWVRGAEPMPEGQADESPWTEYLAHLFPDEEDRRHVSRWLATLIARPAVRMRYGLLLFSNEHGTGKGTLCEVLRGVLGPWNVSVPSESEVVRSDYNDYLAHKTLVFVHEIYAGSTWKAYRNLKEKITDTTIRVNAKYVPGYEIEARAHFILCSNASIGLTIEKQDRRFLVPRVTERRRDQSEWDAFYGWLKGDGFAVIAGWAKRFVSRHGAVRESDLPPVTERKRKLIEDSRSPAHRALADLAEAALAKDQETGTFVSLVDADVAAWVTAQAPEANLPLNVVREALTEGGLFETKRLKIDGRKRTCCVTRESAAGIGASEAKAYRCQPTDLLEPDL